MPKQRVLNLGSEEPEALWEQLPKHDQTEAVVLWARLIALAAKAAPKNKEKEQ